MFRMIASTPWRGFVVATLALPVLGNIGFRHLLDLSTYPSARCLDGSSGAYYRKEGAAENSSNWVFFFEGGGECVTVADCWQRANHSPLGSTKQRPIIFPLPDIQSSSYKSEFRSWNQIYFVYCSGDLHLGTQNQSASIPGLQFSGHHIVNAVLDDLRQKYNLDGAQNVIVSGASAGGIAAFAYVDYVRDLLPSSVRVVGAPIGGFYFSNNWTYAGTDPAPTEFVPWAYDDFKNYYQLWSAFVPTRCASSLPATPWQCIIASVSYMTLNTPVFVTEAQTDAVVMAAHNGLPMLWSDHMTCYHSVRNCPADVLEFMRQWRHNMFAALEQVFENKQRDGVFNPACLMHVGFTSTRPQISGYTYVEAFSNWFFGRDGPHLLQDDCGDVMCNPTCGGNNEVTGTLEGTHGDNALLASIVV